MPRTTKLQCEDCGSFLHKRSMKKHRGSDTCQNKQAINSLAYQNEALAAQVTAQVTAQIAAHNQDLIDRVQTLGNKINEISTRPHTIINNHTHNMTINQFILNTKEPLSLTAIEASVAIGMEANVLRDGAQGIAQYVIRENDLPKKVHISDKSRAVARYHEVNVGDKVINDKGCTMILDHVFVKFGRDGEIVVDRLYDELEKYMTEQNEIGAWIDDFYDQEMIRLGRLRLAWKKASEGHNNKLRKDVAKAIVLRCQ